MRRTQLYLEDRLWKRLHILASQSGTSLSELVRQAVRERYAQGPDNRKEALRAAAGLWRNRADVPAAERYVRRLRKGDRLKRIAR
jgi:hypothetical protein